MLAYVTLQVALLGNPVSEKVVRTEKLMFSTTPAVSVDPEILGVYFVPFTVTELTMNE